MLLWMCWPYIPGNSHKAHPCSIVPRTVMCQDWLDWNTKGCILNQDFEVKYLTMLIFGTTGFCGFSVLQQSESQIILAGGTCRIRITQHKNPPVKPQCCLRSMRPNMNMVSADLVLFLFRLLPYKLELPWDFLKVGISRLYTKRKIKALMGVAQSLHQLFLSWASWARWARRGATAGVLWRPTAQLVLSSLASTSLAVLSDGVPNCWHVQ